MSIVDGITYDILTEIRTTTISPDRIKVIESMLDKCDSYLTVALLMNEDTAYSDSRLKKCRDRLGINQST
jgi:hypothetical protein